MADRIGKLERGLTIGAAVVGLLERLWKLARGRKSTAPRDPNDSRCGAAIGDLACERVIGHPGDHINGNHRRLP